jgi:hypothetical protein
VNGVKGAISGKSVKTVTSYTLAGNIAAGADGINTVNTGGQTIYELYVWNTKPSDGELQALYTELFPAGGSSSGYAQVTHQAQRVYLDGSSNPVNYGSAAGIVDVMDGGAVYIKFQIDCTGGACASTSFVPRYSKDGTTFNLTIPNTIGVDGIAMYGSSADATLNRFAALCCITGALTPNNGVTVLTASATQPVALSINNSYTTGIIVRFGTGLAGQSFWIKLYQENGQALTGTYNPSSGVQIRITASASSGAP